MPPPETRDSKLGGHERGRDRRRISSHPEKSGLAKKLGRGIADEIGNKIGGQAARRGRLEIIRAPDRRGFGLDWLVHGFSTRLGGRTKVYHPDARRGMDLNLGFTADDSPATVAANRRLFLEAAWGGKGRPSLATLHQIHSALIRRVTAGGDWAAPAALRGDGLMTDAPGILLGIQTADCLPVLVADTRNLAVAAFHAGWRGTLARIVEQGVGRMRLEFGSEPEDLIAVIGPGIGLCCYSVGEELRHQFESQFSYASQLFREFFESDPIKERYPLLFLTARAPGHGNLGPGVHLDLAEANRRQLLDAGLRPAAIYLTGECTACQTSRFFSHRSEQGFTGRMMSVIGIRSE